jgi:AraC-like DNA-binding protein
MQPDFSEMEHGPALIALRSTAESDTQFQLGTREYSSHSHVRGQVLCVESGVVHVCTERGSWLLPPHRAGWIPPGQAHSIRITGVMSGWSILIAPAYCDDLPAHPCAIGVNELMHALVSRAASWQEQINLQAEQTRLIAVLLDEIRRTPHQPLHLPMPTDRRVLRVISAMLADPANQRSLQEWASWGGMSARTLSRVIRTETTLSFAQWRQQARLLIALEKLACGEAISDIAEALGYATPSNFIAMFRHNFGVSPGQYFR